MFRDDYAAELEDLYKSAAELAQAHPRIAPMLGRDADPGVTRLFQNAAFLFARLRQRLDDDLPEVIHPVIASVFPALLRPLPCTTIVELALEDTVKEPLVAERGCLFASGATDGSPCVFRSMAEASVRPWTLERVELAAEGRELRLRIALLSGANISGLEKGASLRLYLAGAGGLDLRSALLRHAREAIVRPARRGADAVALVDPGQPPVRAVPAPPSNPGSAGPPALDALRSYFAWPAHFAFVDLPQIDRAVPIAAAEGVFEIVLRLASALPRDVRVGPDDVRLHCVPAINVYSLPAAQFPLRGRRCALASVTPDTHVYDVRSVSLVQENLTTHAAVPYSDFAWSPAADDDEAPLYFNVERLPSVVGQDPIVALAFESEDDLTPFTNADVELDLTDGVRAERVGLGELSESISGSPSGITFRNVQPVTRAAAPAFDGDRLWRWFALLKATLPQLTSAGYLSECIALANHPAWAQWPGAKTSASHFEAIVGVRLGAALGRDDAVVPVVVDVNPATFGGAGDLDLFGERLAAIFASTLRPYETVALTLQDADAKVLFRYPLVPGTREGL